MARRYARDNRGRFSSTGATARGGRLRTAAGNKRATETTKLSGGKASGTVAKPKELKPTEVKTKPQVSSARQAATDRPARQRGDTASVNIPMRGARGRALERDISRAVKEVNAIEIARLMKPKAQVKAERAAKAEANRQAATAKPKRVRSTESLRMSRAKRVLKEREMKTSGTLKQWEQSKRTQERALAFYKSNRKRK